MHGSASGPGSTDVNPSISPLAGLERGAGGRGRSARCDWLSSQARSFLPSRQPSWLPSRVRARPCASPPRLAAPRPGPLPPGKVQRGLLGQVGGWVSGKRASREGAAELRLSPISACAGPVSRGRAAAQAGAGKRRVFPPPSLLGRCLEFAGLAPPPSLGHSGWLYPLPPCACCRLHKDPARPFLATLE